MTKKKTAGKTAKRRAERRGAGHRRITMVIDGERYDALERVAQTMNSVSWCSSDNTPETVFDEFLRPFAEEPIDDLSELCEIILSGIATSDEGRKDAPEPTHSARLDELRAAFNELEEPLMSKIAALLPQPCRTARTA